ncbi:MAG: hypothetical protein CL797_11435, partial [Chromatiales bacterium]|nr:hypothetical protein [Chromatiales bacterium]
MNQFVFLVLMAAFFADTLYQGKLYTGIVGLTIPNVAMYLTVIILISVAIVRGQLGKIRIPGMPFLVVILMAVTLSLIYTGLAGDLRINLIEKLRYAKSFVVEPILLYSISFLFVQNRSQGFRFLAIYCAVIGVLNMLTLAGAELNIALFSQESFYSSGGRFAGFSGNPNKTAYVLCVSMAFQYFFMKHYKSKFIKIIFGVLMLCSVGTMIISGSRGGVVGLFILWFMLLYIWRDYKLLLALPVILLPAFISLMLVAGNEAILAALNRFAEVGGGDVFAATAGRSEIWVALLEHYMSSGIGILIGSGFGVAEFFGIGARAHNMYLQMLVEFGAIGFIFWMFMLVKALRFVAKMRST